MARVTGRGPPNGALREPPERLNCASQSRGRRRRGGASGRAKLPLEVLAVGLDA